MICTRCGSRNCARSHRRKAEFALTVLGILPWKCLDCHARFYARHIPLRYWPYARCARCGNLELLPIRRDRLDFDSRLASWLGARPLRCDFCRYNFASWRRLWKEDKREGSKRKDSEGTESHPEQIDAARARR